VEFVPRFGAKPNRKSSPARRARATPDWPGWIRLQETLHRSPPLLDGPFTNTRGDPRGPIFRNGTVTTRTLLDSALAAPYH